MKKAVFALALLAVLLAGAFPAQGRADAAVARGEPAQQQAAAAAASASESASESVSESGGDEDGSSDDASEPSGVSGSEGAPSDGSDDESDSADGSEDDSDDSDGSDGSEEEEKDLTGIENFSLNMRLRLEVDEREAREAWAKEGKALNESVLARSHALNVAQNRLAAGNTDYEKARILLADANSELSTLSGDIGKATVELERARAARAEAAAHWQKKEQLLLGNRDASLDSVKIVDRIAKTLESKEPAESVGSILRERREARKLAAQQSNSNDTDASAPGESKQIQKIEEAAKAAAEAGLEPQQVSAFRDLITRLKGQLMDHLEKLNEDLVTSREGKAEHLRRSDAEVSQLQDNVDQLRDNVKANTEALAPLRARVNQTLSALGPLNKAAQDALVAHTEEANELTFENATFVRQASMRQRRRHLVDLLHQVVQEQLQSKNPRVQHRLRTVRDLLPPAPRNTTVSLPKVHFVTDTRGLSAMEMEADMCGNWKFDEEDGDGFAIDSSRHAQDGKLHGSNLRRINGSSGRALLFDGMNDYVDVGRVGDFGAEMNNFTVSVWVRTVDRHAGYSSILKTIGDGAAMAMGIDVNRRVGRPSADGEWPTGVQSSSDLAFEPGSTLFYMRDSRGRTLAGHVQTDIYDGKWHHIQWSVFDASANNMAVWIDGAHAPFVASVEQSPERFRNFDANLFVGAADVRGSPMGFLDGAVDNLQLFCSGQRAVFGQKCCRICTLSKACGNDCIPKNATCAREGGCACDRVDLEQIAEQTKEAPKPVEGGAAAANASSSASASTSASEPAQQQQAAQQQQQAAAQQQQAAAQQQQQQSS